MTWGIDFHLTKYVGSLVTGEQRRHNGCRNPYRTYTFRLVLRGCSSRSTNRGREEYNYRMPKACLVTSVTHSTTITERIFKLSSTCLEITDLLANSGLVPLGCTWPRSVTDTSNSGGGERTRLSVATCPPVSVVCLSEAMVVYFRLEACIHYPPPLAK